jgi:hypothetical protein
MMSDGSLGKRRVFRVKPGKGLRLMKGLLMGCVLVGMIGACDSGDRVVDEVTGNRAVKQYHKTKKDIDRIADQQSQRYDRLADDENGQDGN